MKGDVDQVGRFSSAVRPLFDFSRMMFGWQHTCKGARAYAVCIGSETQLRSNPTAHTPRCLGTSPRAVPSAHDPAGRDRPPHVHNRGSRAHRSSRNTAARPDALEMGRPYQNLNRATRGVTLSTFSIGQPWWRSTAQPATAGSITAAQTSHIAHPGGRSGCKPTST